MRSGPEDHSSTQWSLNCKPSNSNCNALTSNVTLYNIYCLVLKNKLKKINMFTKQISII